MTRPQPRPVRLQRRRARGANLQAESIARNGLPALCVTRPGLLGNPFVHPDPAAAVEAYRRLIRSSGTVSFEMAPGGLRFAPNAHPNTLHHAFPEWFRTIGVTMLRGRNLACFCPLPAPGQPDHCHAAVQIEFVCEAL